MTGAIDTVASRESDYWTQEEQGFLMLGYSCVPSTREKLSAGQCQGLRKQAKRAACIKRGVPVAFSVRVGK